MISQQIGLLLLGAVAGAGLSLVPGLCLDKVRRSRDKDEREERAERLLSAIVKEADEGIHRCEELVKLLNMNAVSFSSIYTSLWDSAQIELAREIEDTEMVVLLHRIYYRFHLVNFNMNRGELGVGAWFAKDYGQEMKDNLSEVRARHQISRAAIER